MSIRSTFNFPLQLSSINFNDAGLRFEHSHDNGAWIAPKSVRTVGYVYFELSKFCGMYCNDPANLAESKTLQKNKHKTNEINLPYIDEDEFRQQAEIYGHFKWYFQKIEIILTTKEALQFQLDLIIEVEWPQLMDTQKQLPTIEINRKQNYNLFISNPTNKPILVDYSLADLKTSEDSNQLLPMQVAVIVPDCTFSDQSIFTVGKDVKKGPILIPVGGSHAVPIKFKTRRTSVHCSLVYTRNNQTINRALWMNVPSTNRLTILDRQHLGSIFILRFTLSERKLSKFCAKEEKYLHAASNKTLEGLSIMSRV